MRFWSRFAAGVLSTAVAVLTLFLPGCSSAPREGKETPSAIEYPDFNNDQPEDMAIDAYPNAEAKVQAMKLVADNAAASLYVMERTAEVALVDKASGKIFLSAPYDTASASVSDEQKQKILAPVYLEFYNENSEKQTMNSFTNAAARHQIVLQLLENGVRVLMQLGTSEQRLLLPAMLPTDSFETVLDRLEGRPQQMLKSFYKRYEVGEIDNEIPVYVLKDVRDRQARELASYMKQGGYTFEQMEEDLRLTGQEMETQSSPYFKLALDYELDGGDLLVSLDCSAIEGNEDFQLQKIELLPYFGAARSGEDGYLFLPDGSGAIIRYTEKGQTGSTVIRGSMFGLDPALSADRNEVNRYAMRMPVFGGKTGDAAFLGIIEEGAAVSELAAGLIAADNAYYHMAPAFHYAALDSYEFTDTNKLAYVNMLDANTYSGRIAMRYRTLSGSEADYSGMAGAYRQYLTDKGILRPMTESRGLPLYFTALGAIKTTGKRWIFPVKEKKTLTSFGKMQEIAGELLDAGISDLQIRYLGWANGGLDHTLDNRASVESCLGGKKGLAALAAFCGDKGIGLFPDADLMFTGRDAFGDGFSVTGDTARTLNGAPSRLPTIHYGTSMEDPSAARLMVRPSLLNTVADSFLKAFAPLSVKGLSLGSLGAHLGADYDDEENKAINRAQAEELYSGVLGKAAESYELLVEGGNAYTWPYASHIVGLSSTSNGFAQTDATVPFMQMVLHGSISYAGEPVNISGDARHTLLKAVENGEGLSVVMAGENADALMDSDWREYYAVDYARYRDMLVDMYTRAAEALADTQASVMVRHEQLADGVVRVEYENGAVIGVNYTDEEALIDGAAVPPLSFRRIA